MSEHGGAAEGIFCGFWVRGEEVGARFDEAVEAGCVDCVAAGGVRYGGEGGDDGVFADGTEG